MYLFCMYGRKYGCIIQQFMIDKRINKNVKISSSTMAKIINGKMVALPILEKICVELECNIDDIMEFVELDKVKEKKYEEHMSPDDGKKYGIIRWDRP